MLSMSTETSSLTDRFSFDRHIFLAVAVALLVVMMVLVIFLSLDSPAKSHPNIYVTGAADSGVRVLPLLATFLVYGALFVVPYCQSGDMKAVTAALVALTSLLNSRSGWALITFIALPAQPVPVVYRNRVTMRERRSHRRAIHILTCRSAAKGDGHAAAALTYSFAAITA